MLEITPEEESDVVATLLATRGFFRGAVVCIPPFTFT
jgi:hypothetical protein